MVCNYHEVNIGIGISLDSTESSRGDRQRFNFFSSSEQNIEIDDKNIGQATRAQTARSFRIVTCKLAASLDRSSQLSNHFTNLQTRKR
jgi:hypothetical protein